jgi:hypothetical protein
MARDASRWFSGRVVAALLLLTAALSPTTVVGQAVGTYGVACADTAYFEDRIRHSPVELYLKIPDRRAAQELLRRLGPDMTEIEADALLLLYTPDAPYRMGIVAMAGGCALETGYMAMKMKVDQTLAGLLHEGLIE